MFIVDDIVLSPVKGFMWLVRELHRAAEGELADERAGLMRRLQSLHLRLEAGEISEKEFDRLESELLDRIEAMDEAEEAMSDEGDER